MLVASGSSAAAFAVDVGDHDLRTFVGQLPGDGAADSLSRTCDDCHSILELHPFTYPS
jgi:hypothetical protein